MKFDSWHVFSELIYYSHFSLAPQLCIAVAYHQKNCLVRVMQGLIVLMRANGPQQPSCTVAIMTHRNLKNFCSEFSMCLLEAQKEHCISR